MPTTSAAAVEAATRIARWLRAAVRQRGSASLAVSGGAAPVPVFAELAALDLPWSEVEVWQVDERVAPDGDPARNANLLTALPVRGRRLHLMPVTALDLRAACRRYAATLPERFDVIHLGLGPDGHTASWGPGDPVVDSPEPVALCGEFNGFVRMTLTPGVVNAARHRLMHTPGAEKAVPLRQWLLGDASLPVQRVRRTGTVVVVDAEAATLLPDAGD